MIGTLIAFLSAFRKRNEIISRMDPYATDKLIDEEEEQEMSFSSQSLIMSILPTTGVTYCFLVSVLIIMAGELTDVQHKIAIGAVLAVGLSAFFGNIGRSLFYEEIFDGLDEKGEGSLGNFGRYMIFLVLPETGIILGLMFAQVGLVFSGIAGEGTATFGMDAANSYLWGSVILGLSSSATIAMGYSFDNTEPLYKDMSIYIKKLTKTILPHFVNIAGLVIAIFIMISSGMVG